ncbi:ABC transporter permease [Aerococcaceae bacterium WGS1372]
MNQTYSATAKRYLKFSTSLSFVLSLIIIAIQFYRSGFQWSLISLLYSSIHLTLSLLGLYINLRIQRNPSVQPWYTAVGYLLMIAVLLANPFSFISGMMLILQRVKAHQIYLIFAVLVDFSALAISLLNLTKDALNPSFYLGISYLGISFIIHWILALQSSKLQSLKLTTMKFIVILLVLSSVGGNILSLITAVLVHRLHTTDTKQGQMNILANIARHEVAIFGLYIIVLILTLAISSYLTFNYSDTVENNYSAILQSPSITYPLGTDNFGRDVFSRMIFGGRISILVGFLATIIPLFVGGFLGAISAYYSKKVDQVIMRLLDVLYAIPGILLAITIVTAFGTSTQNLILALSIGGIPGYARTMRASVLQVKQLEYVEAARAVGVSDLKIILKHIIPNASTAMIIRASLTVATAVISTSSLSYLGLGVESHIPEWGNILRIGSDYLETQPYLAIYPGLAIIALVLSFNFLGDGLRDALDPKMH